MPDLHGWLTQQIDEVEQGEPPHARTCDSLPSTASCCGATDCDCAQYDPTGPCDCGWPAQVLRWCAADRKILAAHPYTTRVINPVDGSTSAGFGCETCHDWDGVPEGRGNCATILALADTYGAEAVRD